MRRDVGADPLRIGLAVLAQRADQLAHVTEQRRDLETRVRYLRSDSLSRDLLEERARAAALLHDTLTAHRDARRARVQAPYQRALEELGRTVFGDPLTITVGDDLTIASRTVDGVTVPFDSLSGGAQEQLGVLSRLACARLVDGADGAPVIFDDALGHSDPTRLGAMADALVEAGRAAQVIVFSCVAGRFDALRGRDGVTEVALG